MQETEKTQSEFAELCGFANKLLEGMQEAHVMCELGPFLTTAQHAAKSGMFPAPPTWHVLKLAVLKKVAPDLNLAWRQLDGIIGYSDAIASLAKSIADVKNGSKDAGASTKDRAAWLVVSKEIQHRYPGMESVLHGFNAATDDIFLALYGSCWSALVTDFTKAFLPLLAKTPPSPGALETCKAARGPKDGHAPVNV
jgi:hypothetical protein